jgi:hypothetical protein
LTTLIICKVGRHTAQWKQFDSEQFRISSKPYSIIRFWKYYCAVRFPNRGGTIFSQHNPFSGTKMSKMFGILNSPSPPYMNSFLNSFTHSWSSALLEKPPVVQLLDTSGFYGTRRSITVFTRTLHWCLSPARSIQSMRPHPNSPF